jgi:CBS-domain-containing membrane protein
MLRQILVWLHRALGAALAIVIMEVLAHVAGEPSARVPFVTSIVLVMALPGSDGARPYAVIGGHLLSAASGLIALTMLGAGETSAAVAVGLAVLLMQAARAMHPPAGIGAMLMASQGLPPSWVVSPVLTGAVLLVAYATFWVRLEKIVIDPAERALAALSGGTAPSSPARSRSRAPKPGARRFPVKFDGAG